MRISLYTIFVLTSAFALYPQHYQIQGIVKDLKTKNPLPYANISIEGTQRGTISNLDGEFQIGLNQFGQKLIFSYIGYKADTVVILNNTAQNYSQLLQIYLEPEPILMKEIVVLANKNPAVELIRKAFEKIQSCQDSIWYSKAFYRDYNLIDSNYVYSSEIFYDLLVNQDGIQDWSIRQGRNAFMKGWVRNDYFVMKNLSIYTRQLRTAIKNKNFIEKLSPRRKKNLLLPPLSDNPEQYFNCSIVSCYYQNGQSIAIVDLIPKTNEVSWGGQLEINEENYQIIRYQMQSSTPGICRVFDLSNLLKDPNMKIICEYGEFATNKWGIKRINIFFSFRLKFHDQEPDYSHRLTLHSNIFFYDYNTKDKFSGISMAGQEHDTRIINEEIGYDPEFWLANVAVIDEIPFEKRIYDFYQRHGFYGNLFTGGINVAFMSFLENSENMKNALLSKLPSTVTTESVDFVFNNLINEIHTGKVNHEQFKTVRNRFWKLLQANKLDSEVATQILESIKQLSNSKKN